MEWYWIALIALHFGLNIGLLFFMLLFFAEEMKAWEKIGFFFFGWVILAWTSIFDN
tara:strand:- start:25132 stop:25299 length:168 start_codon:yes stop_codon:yes gene_type:complete